MPHLVSSAGVVAHRSLSVAVVLHFDFGGAPTLDTPLRSHQGGSLVDAVVVAELDIFARTDRTERTAQRRRHSKRERVNIDR